LINFGTRLNQAVRAGTQLGGGIAAGLLVAEVSANARSSPPKRDAAKHAAIVALKTIKPVPVETGFMVRWLL
jgi:hypothetical protein